jgi:hypothetical protein
LGNFLKITEVAKKFRPLSSTAKIVFKNNVLVLTKSAWARFWAHFSQTHLVTLAPDLKSLVLGVVGATTWPSKFVD